MKARYLGIPNPGPSLDKGEIKARDELLRRGLGCKEVVGIYEVEIGIPPGDLPIRAKVRGSVRISSQR